MAGRGVALGRSVLLRDALCDGRRVAPFADLVFAEALFAYYLVGLPATLERPKVADFRAWLQEEVALWLADGNAKNA